MPRSARPDGGRTTAGDVPARSTPGRSWTSSSGLVGWRPRNPFVTATIPSCAVRRSVVATPSPGWSP
ncbi:hypothetical protein V6S67_15790 [Arthrobacter sp. Soc17.1.1.1]|uniref:hypothetical protein n=1 Tax=Arthrobacter sp. Soc17.1.1.1 TaxID=3121277 RepID=UPI002FE4918B